MHKANHVDWPRGSKYALHGRDGMSHKPFASQERPLHVRVPYGAMRDEGLHRTWMVCRRASLVSNGAIGIQVVHVHVSR